MRDEQDASGAHGRRPPPGGEPEFLALDPEMEARMRARRAGAQQRRDRMAETAGAQEKALRAWGPYQLLEELGEGPAAIVWRARDPQGRTLAVKLLRAGGVADSDVMRRRAQFLADEAVRLAQVRHPSLVPVLGVQQHDGRTGLLMEVLAGRTLSQRLRDDGPLPAAQVVALGVRLCDALEALHASGLLHLDVKSRNVVLPDDGGEVLMDPGSVRAIAPGASDREVALSGTPQYIAPELLRGEAPSPAVDVYALGVTLYNAATGGFPVKGPMVREIRAAHARGERVLLAQVKASWPPGVAAAVDGATALEPAQRLATAVELRQALEAAAAELQRAAQPRPSATGRAWAALAAPLRILLSLLGLGVLLLLLWLGTR